ncbi:DUF1003 domain-containing protein [Ligilactobacillus ceti]|uniref:DUF1003 domain-containing protein n=1 Tax=Ligilactobacillus ceti DSM 22408 TaxID=1122146 RepID=A0A0R2KJK7_9LACO|nr:DUF1003 domain-containing protein [Ligilactobacillus ceti]KRN89555.1 hypothetical protein IV53_GL001233 [Ligilactobacillus ceti DSM 22408]
MKTLKKLTHPTKVTKKKKQNQLDLDTPIENTNNTLEQKETFGQQVADHVAKFGGSWAFIIIFCVVLILWMTVNVVHLFGINFDPYPFILLNLFLSCVAAVQAPIIMMSQNRQAERDRIDAENDYAINVRAEKRIKKLQRKIDSASRYQWATIIENQQTEIDLLTNLLAKKEAQEQQIHISITDDPTQNIVAINGLSLNTKEKPLTIQEIKIIAQNNTDTIKIDYLQVEDGSYQTKLTRKQSE